MDARPGSKLDVYTRTCYRIMLGVRQSETHTTNIEPHALAGARPITTIIRERQLQFSGQYLRMTSDEPANIYTLYSPNIATVHQRVLQKQKHPHTDPISRHICSGGKIKLTATGIIKYAKYKSGWIKLVVEPKPPDW
jgi:hypothetical protein